MKPDMVSVIPNAVDANVFTPDASKKTSGKGKWCGGFNLQFSDSVDYLTTVFVTNDNNNFI